MPRGFVAVSARGKDSDSSASAGETRPVRHVRKRSLNVSATLPFSAIGLSTMPRLPERTVIRAAALLSLIFHVVMLWILLTRLSHPVLDEIGQGEARSPLLARLLASPAPTLTALPPPPPSSAQVASPRTVRRTPRAVPPVMQQTSPPAPAVTSAPTPPIILIDPLLAQSPPPLMAPNPLAEPPPPPAQSSAPPPVAAMPMRPAPAADLSTYIEMQRRAMGDPILNADRYNGPGSSSAEIENQRRDRIIASNLAAAQPPAFGYDPRSGGGIFQLTQLGSEYAEFWFVGFNKDFGRKVKQLIEVRKGSYSDIRIAVVRRMIEIVRDEVQGDFSWRSHRLGHDVWMSARPADDRALQDFLMLELFSDSTEVPRR